MKAGPVLDWIDRALVKFPQLKYDDFKDIVEYAQKFGEAKTLDKLNLMMKSPQMNNRIQEKLKLSYPQMSDKERNNLGQSIFTAVQKQFEMIHSPRARPALDNNPSLQQNAQVNQEARALLKARWTGAMDDSADPKGRNAQVVNQNPNDPFVPLFADKLVNMEINNRNENRLRNAKKMMPPRSAPKNKKET